MLRLDIRLGMAVAVMVLAMAWPAGAQRLLETDGIELRGSVRVVTFAAGTCNVVEASHTEAEYERIQANHGQPLDVWQLDFSVYNGSGRWLDHLIARYGIEAKWPDCTNWSGDGPGGGPTGTYSEPVLWASTIGSIQESGSNVVAPGATLTATTFILSFHEDEPRFANWSVDFTFGDPVAAGGAETEAAESTGDAARTASVPGPPLSADRPSEAPAATDQGQPSRIRADQTCAGQPEGAACWLEVADQPECYVWDNDPYPGQTVVTWTGECAGGLAQGTGTLAWTLNSSQNPSESTGFLQDGKQHGHWVIRDAHGDVDEGPYVEGKKHGDWVWRFGSGGVSEGPYVEGKQHGDWVWRFTDGTVVRQRFVNGVLQN